ncbi:antitoxin [Sphingomonas sp. AP4-R1]|nr:antitoxin [Sphingomonas sp. AP4-R1]
MRDPAYRAIFGPENDDARLAQARADIAAGRVVPHEKVAEWLKTWGKPDAGPPPREWFE